MVLRAAVKRWCDDHVFAIEARPAEHLDEKPAGKRDEKQTEQLDEKPVEKLDEQPAEKLNSPDENWMKTRMKN